MIDENKFFRGATLRICGNLAIEDAMRACTRDIGELIPVDRMFLQQDLLRITGDEIVGADFGLREVMHQVRHVAPTESPVLLRGSDPGWS